MILVIGGAYQGKLDFSKNLLVTGQKTLVYADGKTDDIEKIWNATIIDGFHHYIKRVLEQCKDKTNIKAADAAVAELIRKILKENPNVIIIMNEIGYGIVPMNPEDRTYREAAGHAGQLLAKEADNVYRVICGIGSQIK